MEEAKQEINLEASGAEQAINDRDNDSEARIAAELGIDLGRVNLEPNMSEENPYESVKSPSANDFAISPESKKK